MWGATNRQDAVNAIRAAYNEGVTSIDTAPIYGQGTSEEIVGQAIEGIKSRLALEAVIKAEKIEATDKEIEEKIKEMAKNYGKENDKEFLNNENVKKYIKQGIESEKAIDFLVKNAKIK